METQTTEPINFNKILIESNRICKSQRRLFFALSVLFLLPLSVLTVLFQVLQSFISKQTNDLYYDPAFLKNILTFLSLGLFVVSFVFTPCAIASITFAAFHGFNDEHVKLKAALKSIRASFFRIFATTLLFQATIFAATFLFALLVIALAKSGSIVSFADQSSIPLPYLIGFVTAIFVVGLMYVQVNWCLAYVVVVVESTWGYAAFKRSKALIKGKRWTALSLNLFLGIYVLLFFWFNRVMGWGLTYFITGNNSFSTDQDWWNELIIDVLFLLMSVCLITITQLYSLISITVLYAYCKASHRCVDDYSGEYFSLPVNDDKVASLV